MMKIWFSCLMVITIVCQSYAAVATQDVPHQIDTQHIQTEHSHLSDNLSIDNDVTNNEHNIKDCHHCGHCHGSHTPWLANKKLNQTNLPILVVNQYYYLDGFGKGIVEQPIRPPIA